MPAQRTDRQQGQKEASAPCSITTPAHIRLVRIGGGFGDGFPEARAAVQVRGPSSCGE